MKPIKDGSEKLWMRIKQLFQPQKRLPKWRHGFVKTGLKKPAFWSKNLKLLVKFEQNRMVRTLQNYELFDKHGSIFLTKH